jgi:ataxin-10
MGYLPKVYEKVNVARRLFLLEALHVMISTDSDTHVPTTSVTFLAKQFKVHSDCILKTCEKYVEGLEPAEVSKLLQLLACASANSNYRPELQKDVSLLVTCSSKFVFAFLSSQPSVRVSSAAIHRARCQATC